MPYRIDSFQHFPHVIPDATASSSGVMSPDDKAKLDSLTPPSIISGQIQSETFVIDGNQTVFDLQNVPFLGVAVLSVNGQLQRPGIDFEVSENVVTWISTDFSLSSGDILQVSYYLREEG